LPVRDWRKVQRERLPPRLFRACGDRDPNRTTGRPERGPGPLPRLWRADGTLPVRRRITPLPRLPRRESPARSEAVSPLAVDGCSVL